MPPNLLMIQVMLAVSKSPEYLNRIVARTGHGTRKGGEGGSDIMQGEMICHARPFV
jgi:hypothetical protein